MEKKYQVFISSTYEDLKEERKEVIQALLELDCIPVGMELFPAADEDQWSLIQRLIIDCDYYILIIGGRYGSMNKEGISYTQMEYEYALTENIPIISFLHKNPQKIEIGKSETDKESIERLDTFKKKVQEKMCRYWDSPVDLGSMISRSLVKLIKMKPRTGWIKADLITSEQSLKEILKLKNLVESLQEQLNRSLHEPPKGTLNLQQGGDLFTLEFAFRYWEYDWQIMRESLEITYDKIYSIISPHMIDEMDEVSLKKIISNFGKKELLKTKLNKFKEEELDSFMIINSSFQTLKIQFKALGLIIQSAKKRSIKDTRTYWTLTPYGDNLMINLRALRSCLS